MYYYGCEVPIDGQEASEIRFPKAARESGNTCLRRTFRAFRLIKHFALRGLLMSTADDLHDRWISPERSRSNQPAAHSRLSAARLSRTD